MSQLLHIYCDKFICSKNWSQFPGLSPRAKDDMFTSEKVCCSTMLIKYSLRQNMITRVNLSTGELSQCLETKLCTKIRLQISRHQNCIQAGLFSRYPLLVCCSSSGTSVTKCSFHFFHIWKAVSKKSYDQLQWDRDRHTQ